MQGGVSVMGGCCCCCGALGVMVPMSDSIDEWPVASAWSGG